MLQRRRPREVRSRAQVRYCSEDRSAPHAAARAIQQDAIQVDCQKHRVRFLY